MKGNAKNTKLLGLSMFGCLKICLKVVTVLFGQVLNALLNNKGILLKFFS